MRVAGLVPVKDFSAAKGRLSDVLDARLRSELARWMAEGVLRSLADIDVFVACDNRAVAEWAREQDVAVIWGPGLGLNGAIDDGVAAIADAGYDHVIVSHADLPRPASLPDVVRPGVVTLVPDRRRDGTNVMAFPLTDPVAAAYGPGSFQRHLDVALALAIPVVVRADPDLSLDVDIPADLTHPLIERALPTWLTSS